MFTMISVKAVRVSFQALAQSRAILTAIFSGVRDGGTFQTFKLFNR